MDKPPLSARPRRNGWGRKARGVDGLFDVGADLRACTDQPPDNPERDGDILEIDPVWRQSFKTNLFGYFHTVRAVLPAWSGKGMA